MREKGYPELFAAAADLRAHALRTCASWSIGPDDRDKADALDADDRARAAAAGVRFLGHRDDVERLYAGMDMLVLASHREGFPRAAMEAAAMGVPVVATDIRGCRQVVDDGVTGSARAAARSGRARRRDRDARDRSPSSRARMGAARAPRREREFDQQRCIDITLATYRRLLAGARRRDAAR